MNTNQHDDLTPEEREAFEMLPREKKPSRILEERTVRALKERGLIRSTPSHVARIRPWMAATAVAASIAMFATGIAVGQSMGARQTANALATIYPGQTERAAALVQSTGSAHRSALSDLVQVAQSADPDEAARAREVALATFWAAAAEIVRLAPDDPMAARILQEFERARSGAEGGAEGTRSVVWF
jgi:hypothetical protein